MKFKVYLSGEIHTDWRNNIIAASEKAELPIRFFSPVLDHTASDQVGEKILGAETSPFWKDHKAAKINTIRTKTLLEKADIVIVKFGDKYRQWNAAFDAGYAASRGKPLIVIHSPDLTHPLKEVDAAALAVTQTDSEVIEILNYIING